MTTLHDIVAARPYPDYADWWPVGEDFIRCMSTAIGGQWSQAPGATGDLTPIRAYAADYCRLVYSRDLRPTLVDDFYQGRGLDTVQSGEFDSLSYAFYRSAYELIEQHNSDAETVKRERHNFAVRVGEAFFNCVNARLRLALPPSLNNEHDFEQLQHAIQQTGDYLHRQGYLRDHFAFRFDVDTTHGGQRITQRASDVLSQLKRAGKAYALYEMGYPIILPSAVYLFHTLGEAQHHSSRTIEELFARAGYRACETEDFDPTGYPSDMVVELWEISPAR